MNNNLYKTDRYEKNCTIYINGNETTLINYLKEKRIEKKINKKTISNIIKGNDYWYSQIEMGKKDDNRRKYITRLDLIDIISVIIYDAKTLLDLERFRDNSANYLDKIIKVAPYDKNPRIIPLYEIMNKNKELFNPEYINNRINDSLNDLNFVIRDFYNKCNPIEQDSIISFINTLILNLSLEPILTLHYCGIPFCSFFSAQPKDANSKSILDKHLLNDIDSILTKYSQLISENDMNLIISKISSHLYNTNKILNNPFK